MTKEEVNSLVSRICEGISSSLEYHNFNLTIEEEDQIFDLIESIVDKAAGYPEYNHHH